MLKDISKYKNIIAAGLIIFVFFLAARGIVSSYSKDRRLISEQIRELSEGEVTIERWQELSKEAAKVRQDFLKGDNLLLKKKIEEQAQNLNIEIVSLRTNYKEVDFYWAVDIQLQGSCFYADFIKLDEALEAKNIKISKVIINQEPDRAKIRFDVSLEAVILK